MIKASTYLLILIVLLDSCDSKEPEFLKQVPDLPSDYVFDVSKVDQEVIDRGITMSPSDYLDYQNITDPKTRAYRLKEDLNESKIYIAFKRSIPESNYFLVVHYFVQPDKVKNEYFAYLYDKETGSYEPKGRNFSAIGLSNYEEGDYEYTSYIDDDLNIHFNERQPCFEYNYGFHILDRGKGNFFRDETGSYYYKSSRKSSQNCSDVEEIGLIDYEYRF